MCPARRPLAALAPHGITAVLARLPRSPRQDGSAHGGGGPVPHPGRAAARRPLRLRLSAAVAARAGGAGGGGLPSALPGAAEGHPAGALRAGSHRAGQVRHRQDLRVRHHRPGRRAVGEPRHADPDPGSHEGDRGPDPRRDHDHRHKNGRPGVPCVHRGHASEPGQEQAEEVPHRCGLPRADQAADRAGLPEHGQREAAGAGRGRQAAGGGQLPGAGQVRQSPALVAVCSCRCPLRVTALLVSPSWIYSSLPVNKQMLAVSATYPESLAAALTRYMREPTFVRLNPTDPALLGLKQYYKIVNSHPLPHKTFEEKTQHLQELFSKIPFNQALVFSNLHSRAQHLAEILTSRGFPAECISGNMNQNQRLDAMAKLKQFHCRVLISTDLTSRGIDAEKVNLVINLDVPLDWETYMHRIGRAGRFGTLGLAVTYCCRGEEENTMMKIAQKCNLQLLPLPEPIPPGMMEQFEDGQVEVKPAIPTAPVLNCDTVCPKPEQPELQPVQNGFPDIPQPPSNPPRDNSSAERPKKTPKQKQTKKCTNPAKAEKNRSPQTSSCHTEQRNQVKPISRMDGQHSTQAPDEEALKQNLPKIPCLSSFKTQLTSPWSFSDFVEDYDYFIKEGSEREVEILRSYSGPGEQCGLPRNGDVEWEEMEHHPEAAADEAESADSDGSESSRGSFNSMANNGSGSSRASLNSRANNSCSEAFSDTQEPSPVPPARRVPPAFCPTPERPQEPSHSPRQKEAKKKVPKQNAKAKKSQQHQFCSPATSRAEEEQSCSSWEDAAHQGCSSEHHWRCYYQAWQSYYSALSHYSRSYWHLSCISAYHANSVYLQELLRDGD